MLRLRGAVLGCMPALTTAQTLWREQLGCGWQSGTVRVRRPQATQYSHWLPPAASRAPN